MKKINVTISWSGDNYCAGTGEVGGVVMVTNKTYDGVKAAFKEAFEFHVEACLADGDALDADVASGAYEFVYELTAQALIKHFDGILTRSALAKITGINERQIGHYGTGLRTPRPAQREKIINGLHRLGSEFISVV